MIRFAGIIFCHNHERSVISDSYITIVPRRLDLSRLIRLMLTGYRISVEQSHRHYRLAP